MTALPPITVSRRDRDRLHALLDTIADASEVVEALYQELERASVLDVAQMPADVVALNSRVRFINEESGKSFETQLVLPRDHRPGETVSVLMPAGAALLGLKVGDHIAWPSEGKTLRLRLIAVE
ncbi:MAG: nucleoside diphosphate kinase regulator [Pseudomonadales bacterium]|jgi:regulator of nucleoside diphosphate kinase|nr:nucleoside diphosphate kinase regulator [Pseudomonadales bacterium]